MGKSTLKKPCFLYLIIMINISIIGNGYHTNKNLKPSIDRSNEFKIDKIISRNDYSKLDVFEYLISESKTDFVIISTPPSVHCEVAESLLNIGMPTIVEKPFGINKDEVETTIKILKKGVPIMEGLMFLYHPYIDIQKKLINSNINYHIETEFIIPFPENKNFRVSNSPESGSILDTGIYLIAQFYELGFTNPKIKIENSKRPFDTFGEIRGKNNKGSFLGKWGFSDHYKNYLKIVIGEYVHNFNFNYSKPLTHKHIYEVFKKDKLEKETEYTNINQFINMYKFFNKTNTDEIFKLTTDKTLMRWELIDKIKRNEY